MDFPRRSRALIVALWAAGLCACQSQLASDLQSFCQIVTEVQSAQAESTPPDRIATLTTRVSKEIKNPEFMKLYTSLATMPPDGRYDMVMQAADEEGMRFWTCLPLKKLYAELGQHERTVAWDAAQAAREAEDAKKADETSESGQEQGAAANEDQAAAEAPAKAPAKAKQKRKRKGKHKRRRKGKRRRRR